MAEKVLLTWSGGKDSALALYQLQQAKNHQVSALLTTVTEDYDRISMHGVRRILLEQQAESLGLPLEISYITKNATNEEYEARMSATLMQYQNRGVLSVAFGDICLEDIRKYREEKLSEIGMQGIFPLWKRNTIELANTFIDSGFKAMITCVDTQVLDVKFVGREFDKQFLSELPAKVDPCGENGEFHSFVYAGPIFRSRILYKKGEVVLRDNRFCYCDLVPV